MATKDLYGVVVENNLKTFKKLLKEADLDQCLAEAKGSDCKGKYFIVLAPTENAFKDLGRGIVNRWLTDPSRMSELETFLQSHIIEVEEPSSKNPENYTLETILNAYREHTKHLRALIEESSNSGSEEQEALFKKIEQEMNKHITLKPKPKAGEPIAVHLEDKNIFFGGIEVKDKYKMSVENMDIPATNGWLVIIDYVLPNAKRAIGN